MKKTILFIYIFFNVSLSFGQAGNIYFKTKIDSILKYPLFDSTQIALSVYDLTEGRAIFEKDENLLLKPASVLKILTTSAALQYLTPGYNFSTNCYTEGEIRDSILYGNIYIKGGFDPCLSTIDLLQFADAIKKTGIKKINGSVYADISVSDSLFWGKGWMWDDDPDSGAPYMNALPINENAIKVIVSPGGAGEKGIITTIPETSFFNINNLTATVTGDSSVIKSTRDWINRKNDITVSGTIGAFSKPDTSALNIVFPEKFFLAHFKELLNKNGIQFSGLADTLTTPSNARLIYSIRHQLTGAVKTANKMSSNLHAEMILRAIADRLPLIKAHASDGIKYIDSLIILTSGKGRKYYIADGSGVSSYNQLSTSIVINVLNYIYGNQELFNILTASLPVAGVDGTLAGRMKDFSHLQNIYAKTGSMRGVSNLAGYIQTMHGHTISFALFIQNFTGSPKRIRDLQDEICRAIYLIKSDKDE